MLVRDLNGRRLGHFGGGVLHDVGGGRVLGKPSDDGETSAKLTGLAADWMTGRRVAMADLGTGDVLKPATQADFFMPALDGCIADEVAPVKLVKHDRGYFYYENTGDVLSLVMSAGAGDGASAEVNPQVTATSFTCSEYALGAKLPRQVVQSADFDLKKRTTRRLVEGLRLLSEWRLAQLVTKSASWNANNAFATGGKWNGPTPTVIADVFQALQLSALSPTHLVLPEIAAPYFHGSQVRDFIQAGGQLPQVRYARARYMVGGLPNYVWAPAWTPTAATTPVNIALMRAPQDIETDIPSAMRLRWDGGGDDRDGVRKDGVLVREFFSSQDDAWWIVVSHTDAEVIVNGQVGALITGAVS